MPMNDDHGDRFPGALPTPSATAPRSVERLVRMRAHVAKGRSRGARPPVQTATTLDRMSRFSRRSLNRFDSYTLEVFNPGHPYRPHAGR